MSAENRARRGAGKGALALKITVGMLIIALGVVSVLAYFSFSNLKMMQAEVDTDRIYPNVFVNDVNVGGLTKDEALVKLQGEFLPELQEKTITVTGEGKELFMSFDDFSVKLDFTEGVTQAYDYARDGSLKERYEVVTALEHTPHKITSEPKYSYDTSGMAQKLEALREHVNLEFVNSTITRENGAFKVSESRVGRALAVESTAVLVEEVLKTRESGMVTAVVELIQPQITPQDFDHVQSLIGTFTTKLTPGNAGRTTNIATALDKINDVVLAPDEVFSTNYHFGAMTYDNGYRLAPVIQGGKLIDGMGGGVCQVSSTLYNAVLFAELEIVERRNHSLKVGYVDYGFDATLAGDYIDFKFKNDTEYPVFVEALLVNDREVTVNLYGCEVHNPGRKLVFEKTLVETVKPDAEIVTEDPELPEGTRIEKTRALQGYRYRVFKKVYENDKEIETVLVNNSYYVPTRGEVTVGIGPTTTAANAEPPEEAEAHEAEAQEAEVQEAEAQEAGIPQDVADPAPIQPEDDHLPVMSEDE